MDIKPAMVLSTSSFSAMKLLKQTEEQAFSSKQLNTVKPKSTTDKNIATYLH